MAGSIADFIASASGSDLKKVRQSDPILFGGIGDNVRTDKNTTDMVRKAMLGKLNKGKRITEGAAGKPEEGLELLKNIAKLPGATGRVNSMIAGAEGGFGSVGVQHFRNAGDAVSQGIQDEVWSYGKSRSGRNSTVVPYAGGAYLLTASEDTEVQGRGLIDAYKRAADIKQRRYAKTRASANVQSGFGAGRRRRSNG